MRLVFCAVLFATAPVPFAQDVPASGFSLSPAAFAGASSSSASASLSNGGYVLFDGQDVVQYASDGTALVTLGSLASPTFASFVTLDPSEQFVCIGEGSNGNLYRLALGVSGTPEFLAHLPFNYDAVVSGNRLYVSAATCGFFCGNEIWRVDLGTHVASLVAQVSGASGPLAVSPLGDLYYGSVSGDFPPPHDSAAVWRWSRAQLDGPQVLGLADATRIGAGFEGAARLAYDPRRAELLLAEVSFATGENRLVRVRGDADASPVLVEGRPFFAIGSLQFHAPAGPARFLPYQPAGGGTLSYATTDFSASVERFELRPLRPTATLTVPSPGQLQLRLVDGPPNGVARILLGPRNRVLASEHAFRLVDLPIFFGLERATQTALPGFVVLDAAGGFTQVTPDPSGIGASIAVQLVLYEAGFHPLGTSSVAVL